MTSHHPEPCFRIYLGKSNWVNLSPKVTADLKAIYEQGVPTRYYLAPGLPIDILPNDVDCNSKTTELPSLMRADLCYEEGSPPSTASGSERQGAAQQTLSRFIKAELESQGIVDAFPPTDSEQDLLPHVFDLAPHRHLGLVPIPPKSSKRINQQLTDSVQAARPSPWIESSPPTTHSNPDTPIKRKQPKKARRGRKAPVDNSSAKESPGKRIRQHPPAYYLRSHDDDLHPNSDFYYPQADKPSLPNEPLLDGGEGRSDFFSAADLMAHERWYPSSSMVVRHPPAKHEPTWELYGLQPQPQQQQEFDMFSSSSPFTQPLMPQLDIPSHRYYPE